MSHRDQLSWRDRKKGPQEIRKQIEKKYNPSTIFRTYPGTICQSYRASWNKIAEQTIEVYRKALVRRA